LRQLATQVVVLERGRVARFGNPEILADTTAARIEMQPSEARH